MLCDRARAGKTSKEEFDLLSVFQALSVRYGSGISAQAFAQTFRKLSLVKLQPFEGICDLLESLRAEGAKLYLLSNAQACFTRAELKETGLETYFDGILLSSEAGYKKPSAEFFEAAFARFSLLRENGVYVGNDLFDDVGGAHAAGLPCVYLHTEQSGEYDDPPVPDYVAKDVGDLKRILVSLIKQ